MIGYPSVDLAYPATRIWAYSPITKRATLANPTYVVFS